MPKSSPINPPPKSLSAAIRAAIPDPARGTLPWYERLPADKRAELEELKREHRAGLLPGTRYGLAATISEELRVRGLVNVGIQGVSAWLRKG